MNFDKIKDEYGSQSNAIYAIILVQFCENESISISMAEIGTQIRYAFTAKNVRVITALFGPRCLHGKIGRYLHFYCEQNDWFHRYCNRVSEHARSAPDDCCRNTGN